MSIQDTIPGFRNFPDYPSAWQAIRKKADQILEEDIPQGQVRLEILKQIIGLIDLTTLEGTDNHKKINELCDLALRTARTEAVPAVPAVCVYPLWVEQAVNNLEGSPVKVASVAGGFPSGQTFAEVKISEIRRAVESGASEVDTVINRGALLEGKYVELFEELSEQKRAAGSAHLKVILETCELPDVRHVRDASVIAILAGADFIKTSTGKGTEGATLPAFLVMAETIHDHFRMTGKRVGIKAAGGIRTDEDVLPYYLVVKKILGEEWLTKDYFRIGASSLLKFLLNEGSHD